MILASAKQPAPKPPKGVRILKMREAVVYRYSAQCRKRGCKALIQGCWMLTREEAIAGAPPPRKQRCAAHPERGKADARG